jgi:hypothetical protein
MAPTPAPVGSDIGRISTPAGKIVIPNQENLVKKRKSGEFTAPHTFGADGYVYMGQRAVNPHIYFL